MPWVTATTKDGRGPYWVPDDIRAQGETMPIHGLPMYMASVHEMSGENHMTPQQLAQVAQFQLIGDTVFASVCLNTPDGPVCFNTSVALHGIRKRGEKFVAQEIGRKATRKDKTLIEGKLESAARVIAAKRLYAAVSGNAIPAEHTAEVTGWTSGTGLDFSDLASGALNLLPMVAGVIGGPAGADIASIASNALKTATGLNQGTPQALAQMANIASAAKAGDPQANQAIGAIKAMEPIAQASIAAGGPKAMPSNGTVPYGNLPVIIINTSGKPDIMPGFSPGASPR